MFKPPRNLNPRYNTVQYRLGKCKLGLGMSRLEHAGTISWANKTYSNAPTSQKQLPVGVFYHLVLH